MVEFEKKFQEKTGNKWKKREFFEQKPGKYILFNREQEKELTKKYQEQEKAVLSTIEESSAKFQISRVPNDMVRQLVSISWDLEHMKACMREMQLDDVKIPMGKI